MSELGPLALGERKKRCVGALAGRMMVDVEGGICADCPAVRRTAGSNQGHHGPGAYVMTRAPQSGQISLQGLQQFAGRRPLKRPCKIPMQKTLLRWRCQPDRDRAKFARDFENKPNTMGKSKPFDRLAANPTWLD